VTIDLDAYLARIGYDGPRVPTAGVLRELHRLHPQAIAYENLSPLLGRPVPLDDVSLQGKMLRDGRGGYCYEQNLLFAAALTALGFRWRLLTGWPRWGVPAQTPRPRIHAMLLVQVEGEEWLCDVGFGGNTLTAPLLARSREVQETPHEPARLINKDATQPERLMIQTEINNAWHDLVELDFSRQTFAELEMANWFTSAHPKSRFRNELFVARPDEGCRYVMLDNVLSIYRMKGENERRILASTAEIRDALHDLMHIRLPHDPSLDTTLSRIAANPRTQA
jgi:N-hydroxyarylamine O-acetyltransferase